MDLSCSFPVLCVQASGHSCLKSTAYVSWGNGHGKDDREMSSKICGCFGFFFNLSITSFEWERDSPINQSTYWCCEQPVTHWGNETLDCHISSRGMITRGALMCFPAANLYDNHSLAKTPCWHHFPYSPWNAQPYSTRGTTQLKPTHPKVKAVEWGMKVISWSQSIHLQRHLSKEQTQKNKLGEI